MSDTIIASIITGAITLVVGFFSGYQYSIKVNIKRVMNQKSGDNSNQVQIGEVDGRK